MATCLVLVRRRGRTDSKISIRSELLYKIIEPIATKAGYHCEQVDPRDFGLQDARLFHLIQSADVMVVDISANSMDYLYSLGVRHALNHKPTIILEEVNYIPSDVSFPRGVLLYSENDLTFGGPLYHQLKDAFRELSSDGHYEDYSPVRTALEAVPRVFLSYAHADVESMRAVDQWLRDKGARVDIDERNFIAGSDIREEIVQWIRNAGKVVCFYSKSSFDRYYPKLERRIVEELEQDLHYEGKKVSVLLYFRLDETPLPKESSHRLAINAWQLNFENACNELWRHLLGKIAEPKRIPLNKYKKKAPWGK